MRAGAGQSDFWDHITVQFGNGCKAASGAAALLAGMGAAAGSIYCMGWLIAQAISHFLPLIRGH
jgi:hypothetical protein